MNLRSSRNPALVLFSILLMLSQMACLRTRMKTRDGDFYDSTPASSSAPSSGESAAVAASSSYVIDELKAEIARLTGRIEELERQKTTAASNAAAGSEATDGHIKAIEQRVIELEKTQLEILERFKGGSFKASGTSAAPSSDSGVTDSHSGDSAGQFEKGRAAHAAGKFEEAIGALDGYISKSPKGKNLEEALFLKGDSEFLTKQYRAAIVSFDKMKEKFPKSKRVPVTLLKIAQSFEALGMADDARGFYQELVEKFPKSSEAKKAKARLKG
jgi:tol-pal system protein YbgF